jgi:hypothetical protein
VSCPAAHLAREYARDLLQVETRGPFNYDAERNVARFDVLPQTDTNLTNDVRVTKVPPRPSGLQTLFSQVLEIEFNGSPTGGQPAKSAAPPVGRVGAAQPGDASAEPPSGPKFTRLHAWTYTPGRFLTIASDGDQLQAYGQDLVRDQTAERTVLTGAPLTAMRERNVLTAGTAKVPAVLTLEPPPNTPPGPDRKALARVHGPGRVELHDGSTGTTAASWQTSMVQTRERSNGRELDLFTFTDGAKFEDVQADYWLKGNVLKLWLAAPEPGTEAAGGTPQPGAPAQARPHRVQAVGNVSGHSADIDIEQAEQLDSWFKDVPPPAGPVVLHEPTMPPREPKEPKERPAGSPPPLVPRGTTRRSRPRRRSRR